MRLADIKNSIVLNLKNIPAPAIKRKVVIIESDDYGGIRMPSNEAFKRMVSAGIHIDASRYNTLDTLESNDDLAALFETLSAVKDKNGRHAVVSPFVNVANPDFDKIKAANYEKYFYEPFTATLLKYGRGEETMQTWRQGMNDNIFAPEFHGREHISVQPWLEKLQQGNVQLQHAFSYGFVAVGNIEGIHPYAQEFRPEFYFTKQTQKNFLHQSIIEGVALFEKIFNYTPSAFIPSNHVFHPDFEDTVYKSGVLFLNVEHKNPTPGQDGFLHYHAYTNKQKIKKKALNFYIRNCAFEPTSPEYKSCDGTLKQINAAFRFGKAAIISTHRVNFTGGLNIQNRDKGLLELNLLLTQIIKRWPTVEFMSTRDYVNLLLKKTTI